jgi:hypothetical protein
VPAEEMPPIGAAGCCAGRGCGFAAGCWDGAETVAARRMASRKVTLGRTGDSAGERKSGGNGTPQTAGRRMGE